jgi:hypothetical protein
MKYEECASEFENIFIKRINEDGSESHIPADPANRDYQAYLASLEALQG